MSLDLKFNNTDAGTVLAVQRLRLHLPKCRMLGSTHRWKTKIMHVLELLTQPKKQKTKNTNANLTFRPNTHTSVKDTLFIYLYLIQIVSSSFFHFFNFGNVFIFVFFIYLPYYIL